MRRVFAVLAVFGLGSLLALSAAPSAQAMGAIQNAYDLYNYRISTDLARISYDSTGNPYSAVDPRTVRAQAAGAAQAATVYNEPGKVPVAQVETAKAEAKSKWRLPATNMKPLVKTVGGAATAITGYSLGAQIGGAGLQLFGVDSNGLVCASDASGFLSVVTGQDCSQYGWSEEFVPNLEGGLGAGVCNVRPLVTGGITVPSGQNPGTPDCNSGVARAWNTMSGQPAIFYDRYTVTLLGCAAAGSQLKCDFERSANTANPRPGSTVNLGGGGYAVMSCINKTTFARGSSTPMVNEFWSGTPGTITLYGPSCGATQSPLVEMVTSARTDAADAKEKGGVAYWGGLYTPPVADPERMMTCEILGSDGQTYSASTPAYRETDAAPPVPECPALPAGVVPSNVKVGDGQNTLYDEAVAPGAVQHMQEFPECGDGSCILDLRDSEGKSCFRAGASCSTWFSDPQQAQKYSCHYGTHAVPIGDCYVYRDVFDPAKRQAGQAYVDPVTGDRVEGNVKTSTPGAATDGNTRPVTDSDVRGNCWGAGWGDPNPLNWVMQPVQCALEWAFVPRPSIVAAAGNNLTGEWNTRAPGQLALLVEGWEFDPYLTGCRIDIDYPLEIANQTVNIPVIDACPGSLLEGTATLSRLIMNVSAVVLTVVLVRRAVAGTVDYKGQ